MPSYDDLIRSLRICACEADCDGCIMQGEDPGEFGGCDDLLMLRAVDAILDLVGRVEKDCGTKEQSSPEIEELYDDLMS